MLLQTDRKLIEVMSLFESCVVQFISKNQVLKLSDTCPLQSTWGAISQNKSERAFNTGIKIKQNQAFLSGIKMVKYAF